ncbi:MAG: response regulator transcription factor [Imperialibacter sp.]|uniref:LytR/AlgR family response regulator transcription factor n=1 Tax=Imperialibacter sp. TaxID=2038411 RepID=UPI0032EE1DC5
MKASFRILIVDDELMIAEMAREMLLELGYFVVGVAKNYAEALKYLEQADPIDMAILDINLNETKSGIDLGQLLRDRFKIPFVYLTSYTDPETIRAAVDTAPSAYLIKPFSKSDLHATVEIIKIKKQQITKSIMVRLADVNIRVESKDILYIKSDNNYIEIFTQTKKYVHRQSLEGFLDEIQDSNFVRIHRSYAINLQKVEAINGRYVVINDEKISLSRTYKAGLMDLLRK